MGAHFSSLLGIFDTLTNSITQENQLEENSRNRQYNAQEAEKSRQFIDQQRIAAQEYQSTEWDRQQAYNTPAMQVQRLREGGINPAVYFSGSQVASGSSVSAPSGGSAPAASFNGGVSPSALQLPSFGDIGQFVKNLSEARKNVADTKTTDLMRDPMYRQALTQLVGQELANKSLDLANKFNESTLPDRVKKEYHDAMYAALQCRLADTEDDLKQSEIQLNQSMERLNHSLSNKHGTEGLILLNELANWKSTYDSMLKVRRSEIAKNKAQAAEASASAKEHISNVDVNVEKSRFQKFDNDMRDNFKSNVYESYVSSLVNNGLISKAEAEEAKKKLSVIEKSRGNEYYKAVDDALEYIKGKVSIFK